MPTTLTLPEKVVDYIGYTDAAMEKAAAFQQKVAAQQVKIAELIPAAVNALIEHGCIPEEQREKAAEALRDPVRVIEILTKTAAKVGVASLGSPVDGTTKTASAKGGQPYDSLNDPHVGAKSTRIKQSDANFFKALGIAPPDHD